MAISPPCGFDLSPLAMQRRSDDAAPVAGPPKADSLDGCVWRPLRSLALSAALTANLQDRRDVPEIGT